VSRYAIRYRMRRIFLRKTVLAMAVTTQHPDICNIPNFRLLTTAHTTKTSATTLHKPLNKMSTVGS